VKAALAILLVGLALIGGLWGPAESAAESAADCLYLLNTPCLFLGIDLWQLPADWTLAVVHFPWLLPLLVVAPATVVLAVEALLVRRNLEGRRA
jgi:hypothetical protein